MVKQEQLEMVRDVGTQRKQVEMRKWEQWEWEDIKVENWYTEEQVGMEEEEKGKECLAEEGRKGNLKVRGFMEEWKQSQKKNNVK